MPPQSNEPWLAGCDSDDCWGWIPCRDFGLAPAEDGVGAAVVPDAPRKEVNDRDRDRDREEEEEGEGGERKEEHSRSVSISNSGVMAFIHRRFVDSNCSSLVIRRSISLLPDDWSCS